MNYIADLHTHTIASDHAYSTLLENIEYAKRAGMQALAITDHGPGVEDAPHLWHLLNMKSLPREIEGVRILRGVEANIMDMEGNLDMGHRLVSRRRLPARNSGAKHPGLPRCSQKPLCGLDRPQRAAELSL